MENQNLKIEVVRLNRLDGEGRTKAFCDISLSDTFIIKGFRVVEGKEGLFVSMPREPGKDGKWYTRFVPLKSEVRDELSRIVLEAYECEVKVQNIRNRFQIPKIPSASER